MEGRGRLLDPCWSQSWGRGAGGTGKRRLVILYAILPGMTSKLSLMDGRLRCENEGSEEESGEEFDPATSWSLSLSEHGCTQSEAGNAGALEGHLRSKLSINISVYSLCYGLQKDVLSMAHTSTWGGWEILSARQVNCMPMKNSCLGLERWLHGPEC